jgi:lysyl-tRNA synthetase class 2
MKRRLKQEKKQKEKDLKAQQQQSQHKTPDKSSKSGDDGSDTLDPNQYFKLRSQMVKHLKQSGPHPYPHKFHVTSSLTDFIQSHSDLEAGERREDVTVSISGEGLQAVEYLSCDLHHCCVVITWLSCAYYV